MCLLPLSLQAVPNQQQPEPHPLDTTKNPRNRIRVGLEQASERRTHCGFVEGPTMRDIRNQSSSLEHPGKCDRLILRAVTTPATHLAPPPLEARPRRSITPPPRQMSPR